VKLSLAQTNGSFVINVDDNEGVNITDEMLVEAGAAFGHDLGITQEELDVLLDVVPRRVEAECSPEAEAREGALGSHCGGSQLLSIEQSNPTDRDSTPTSELLTVESPQKMIGKELGRAGRDGPVELIAPGPVPFSQNSGLGETIRNYSFLGVT
jgi:hypothetical protein